MATALVTLAAVPGSYAYVADSWRELRVIDISNPSSASELGYYDALCNALSDSYIYVADEAAGLQICEYLPPEWGPRAYDENQDSIIQKMEAIEAVIDYFDGEISKEEAIEVVMLYFR